MCSSNPSDLPQDAYKWLPFFIINGKVTIVITISEIGRLWFSLSLRAINKWHTWHTVHHLYSLIFILCPFQLPSQHPISFHFYSNQCISFSQNPLWPGWRGTSIDLSCLCTHVYPEALHYPLWKKTQNKLELKNTSGTDASHCPLSPPQTHTDKHNALRSLWQTENFWLIARTKDKATCYCCS